MSIIPAYVFRRLMPFSFGIILLKCGVRDGFPMWDNELSREQKT